MQVSDIFVFPSRREGLGRVVLEAMSVELPCICSLLEGIVYDMIEPEVNGIVVGQIEPGAFAAQVVRLADDPVLRQRLGGRARQTVVSRFDERNFAGAYRTLFEEILGINEKCKR
jgi:glycosyltransferase involved in cell wall biosynthesis